jgi:hypothetical protein
LNSDGGSNLAVNVTGGSAVFGSTQHLKSVNVSNGARAAIAVNGNRALYTSGLTLNASGTLDTNDNDLVVSYTGASPFTTLRQAVYNGYSAAPNPAKTGIISTTGQSAGNTILALFDNALVGASEWPTGSGNTIAGNSVVGKYTYFGDANFDGRVTADDYGVLDANLGSTPALGVAWMTGDTNLDGSVTADDYSVLDANLGSGYSSPLVPAGTASVPEPAGAIFLLGAGVLVMRRRCREKSA